MEPRPFQDEFAQIGVHQCWGCGSQNEHGLQIKSFWEGDEGVCAWQPQLYHQAWPGMVNGGILSAIIDCHCTCTAIAAAYRAAHRAITTLPLIGMVTAELRISYLRPTPIAEQLHLRATMREQTERKTILACTLSALGEVCVRAEAVVVRSRASPDASRAWQGCAAIPPLVGSRA
jgi:acyl-coenzyme A thioesterase PaaI-like protein